MDTKKMWRVALLLVGPEGVMNDLTTEEMKEMSKFILVLSMEGHEWLREQLRDWSPSAPNS